MEHAVFTNMCMIEDGCGNILVQDRLNPDWPGITFPGGHVEPGESFVASVIREVQEETGLTIQHPHLCGIKQFQTRENARYIVLFFKTGEYGGSLTDSPEGRVFWIPRSDLKKHVLAPDFEKMLEVFEDDSLSEFYYHQGRGGWQASLR